jgi:hypothetical protein
MPESTNLCVDVWTSTAAAADLLEVLRELPDKSDDMATAEKELLKALKASVEINEKLEKLVLIRQKLNDQLGKVDLANERRRFFEEHTEGYYEWASGKSSLPSSKQLDSIENSTRLLVLAAAHMKLRILALDTGRRLAKSDELNCQARVLLVRSREENYRTASVLSSMRQALGEPDEMTITGGPSQRIEAEADLLTKKSAGLYAEAETQKKLLDEMQKEQNV